MPLFFYARRYSSFSRYVRQGLTVLAIGQRIDTNPEHASLPIDISVPFAEEFPCARDNPYSKVW
jgi:hypothetical protein